VDGLTTVKALVRLGRNRGRGSVAGLADVRPPFRDAFDQTPPFRCDVVETRKLTLGLCQVLSGATVEPPVGDHLALLAPDVDLESDWSTMLISL